MLLLRSQFSILGFAPRPDLFSFCKDALSCPFSLPLSSSRYQSYWLCRVFGIRFQWDNQKVNHQG